MSVCENERDSTKHPLEDDCIQHLSGSENIKFVVNKTVVLPCLPEFAPAYNLSVSRIHRVKYSNQQKTTASTIILDRLQIDRISDWG